MGREPRTAARPAPQTATDRRHDRQVLAALERIAGALEQRPRVVVLAVGADLTAQQQADLAGRVAEALGAADLEAVQRGNRAALEAEAARREP